MNSILSCGHVHGETISRSTIGLDCLWLSDSSDCDLSTSQNLDPEVMQIRLVIVFGSALS